MKTLLAILILVVLGSSASFAIAADLVVSREVLEDKTGRLTIADVASRQFKPVGPTLSRGFTKSVYWLRLHVQPPVKGKEVVLLIRQPFLNEIYLYEADADSPQGWKSRVTGNLFPFSARERLKRTLGFVVTPKDAVTTYYLRLKTATQVQMSVEALDTAEAERMDDRFDLMEVFFVTSMFLLLLWALHSYLLDRLPVVGLFAIHQAAYTLFGVAVTGYLAPYLPVGHPDLVNFFTAIPYCAVAFTTLLFCRELFRPYQPPPVLMRGLNLFLLIFPLQLAAMFLGYTPVAVMVNAVLIKVSWWYFVVMTFTFRREQSPSRRLLQIFFVVITLVFTLFWYLSSSSAGTNINIGRQILIANGLIIGGLFAMLLNARSRRLQQQAQKSAMELQAKSEFLALVSHEIRTPLNALVGFSGLARKATDPARIDQYLAILEKSSHALMTLVNDILDMSKIEAGRLEVEAVPFNLHQLVAGLTEQYQTLADQKQLSFRVNMANDLPVWILGDPVRLRQILTNLLSNALKFTECGEIACTVSRLNYDAALRIRFEVRDSGIGMPDSKRALLFKPFQQLDSTITRKYGGTGLGLAIVYNLVTMMQGCITVESQENRGSSFVVELPFQIADAVQDEVIVPPAGIMSGTILVIEDNGFNRRLLGDVLTDWGQQVVLAEDGQQGLQFMEQQRFDLILLDIRMPGIDGIEVARRIRQQEREQSEKTVPIIAITADTDATTREACLKVGINDVLSKPVIPEQLSRVISDYCGGRVEAFTEGVTLDRQTCSDLGTDPERVEQYRSMLQADLRDELQSLHLALGAGDHDDFCCAAHTLKGLCGHLHNPKPAELAGWLQLNASSGSPEQLQAVLGQLQSLLALEDTP